MSRQATTGNHRAETFGFGVTIGTSARRWPRADRTYAPDRYDLRGVGDAMGLLTDIADCGPADLLVDSATAQSVRQGTDVFPALSIVHTEGVPQTFRPACGAQYRPGAHAEVMRNCVVVTAAVHLIGDLLTEVRAGAG